MTRFPTIPHLRKTGTTQQLVVNDRPFLALAAELQNSSMTSAEFIGPIWQKLVDTNINTVLGCVTWEDIEPVEGQFNFTVLDKVILGARKHGLHLVLLWFGSFKNGMVNSVLISLILCLWCLLTIFEVYPPTPHHGSRQTRDDSLVPSYARLEVSSRPAMCFQSSMTKGARPTPRHLPV